MSTQERWDIALKVLGGPLAGMGEQVFRGPVVRLGANPGPGGFKLGGYRGLDARQCVITAYTGGQVSVAPVGSNQIRLAPHSNVKWKEIDPITGPEYLSDGCAVHLGPVGRGATIEFVEARRLGVWEKGRLASDVADVAIADGGSANIDQAITRKGPVPASYKVGNVQTSTAPFWFLGCMFLMSSATAVSLLAIGGFVYFQRNVVELGPDEPGYEFYESIDLETAAVDTDLFEGLQKPFYDFVMAPNAEAAGGAQKDLDAPENWDQIFLQYTTASVDRHVRAWKVFRRLEAIKSDYAKVVSQLRASELPEVMAAIPYQESRYRPELQSVVCAKGYWQFMPEVALRVERKAGLPFKVRDCKLRGTNVKWTPKELAPPNMVAKNGEYMDEGQCMIDGCAVDDRLDLKKSTDASMYTLGEAFRDPTLRRSGSVVQMTIASHNAGYDDGRFTGRKKSSNILISYNKWIKKNGKARGPYYYGDNILCRTHEEKSWCGGAMPAETQHYVYSIVAQHLLAVCYYAQNYGEDRAFNPWVQYTTGDGYCKRFKIPSRAEVLRQK